MEVPGGLSGPADFHQVLFQGLAGPCVHCRMVYEDGVPVDWVYLDVNPAFERQTGSKDCRGRRGSELVPWFRTIPAERFAAYARAAQGGSVEPFETYLDETRDWFSVQVLGCAPGEFIAVFDRITRSGEIELKRAMAQTEKRFRIIAEEAPVPLAMHQDGRVAYANPAMARLLRAPSPAAITGMRMIDFVPPEDHEKARARLAKSVASEDLVQIPSQTLVRLDGTRVECAITGRSADFEGGRVTLAFVQDLTELRRSQEAELQARKAESLLLMAGSIAHDFNNLFAALSASLEILGMLAPDRPDLLETLATASEVLRRAVQLSWKMNEFSGRTLPRLVRLDLANLVGQRVSHWGDRQPILALGDAPLIKGDPASLGKVLDAVVQNAWEAMDEAKVAGQVRISLESDAPGIPEDETLGHWAAPRPGGRTVRLEIANDGPSPSREIMAQMFDPFFTTRFMGRGLGLASVLGLLQAHGAGIHVLPGKAGGLVFRIHFKAAGA